jgi:hypothetical protein
LPSNMIRLQRDDDSGQTFVGPRAHLAPHESGANAL